MVHINFIIVRYTPTPLLLHTTFCETVFSLLFELEVVSIRGKVRGLGQKHVNIWLETMAPIPYTVLHPMLCDVLHSGWGDGECLGGSSVREWCFARDNSPTTAAIYHPPFFPSLPCTKCCLATTKTFWEITLPLVSGEPFWQTILTNGFGFYIERCVISFNWLINWLTN